MFNIKKWLGLTEYISELDQFLKHFDRTHSRLSSSQREEVEKYKRIFYLRDNAASDSTSTAMWNNF